VNVVPPFYLSATFLAPVGGSGTVLLVSTVVLATAFYRRRRQVQAYEKLAVKELSDARQMQMDLFPADPPAFEGVEIAGHCLSANAVGGDFYDFLIFPEKKEIGLVVADVTGKGMQGAMNAVMTNGILHSLTAHQPRLQPGNTLVKLNDLLTDRMEQDLNVTMSLAALDLNTRALTLANAGHHAHPLLIREGKVKALKTAGLPLGMKGEIDYRQERFDLEAGDVIILMSDGIIEALSPEERLYAETGRLEKLLSQASVDLSAKAMVRAILDDANDFAGNPETRDDDMTVLVAKVL